MVILCIVGIINVSNKVCLQGEVNYIFYLNNTKALNVNLHL